MNYRWRTVWLNFYRDLGAQHYNNADSEACREGSWSSPWAEQVPHTPGRTERWGRGQLWAPVPLPQHLTKVDVNSQSSLSEPGQPVRADKLGRVCVHPWPQETHVVFRRASENESGREGWYQNNFSREQCPFLRKRNNYIYINVHMYILCQYGRNVNNS